MLTLHLIDRLEGTDEVRLFKSTFSKELAQTGHQEPEGGQFPRCGGAMASPWGGHSCFPDKEMPREMKILPESQKTSGKAEI